MFIRRKPTLSMLAVMLVTTVSTACGQSLSASSTCADLMRASQADRDQAVAAIASDEHAPNSVTPLGRPNIEYLCAQAPHMTLGEAIRRTG